MIRSLLARFAPRVDTAGSVYCAECGWWVTDCPHQK
jgi:hypothetical protein